MFIVYIYMYIVYKNCIYATFLQKKLANFFSATFQPIHPLLVAIYGI